MKAIGQAFFLEETAEKAAEVRDHKSMRVTFGPSEKQQLVFSTIFEDVSTEKGGNQVRVEV